MSRVNMFIHHLISLCHPPDSLKWVNGVRLHNSNKLDYTTVKFYQVISFLNCLKKVSENGVADMLPE